MSCYSTGWCSMSCSSSKRRRLIRLFPTLNMFLTGCYDNRLPFSSSLVGLSPFDSVGGVCQVRSFSFVFFFFCFKGFIFRKNVTAKASDIGNVFVVMNQTSDDYRNYFFKNLSYKIPNVQSPKCLCRVLQVIILHTCPAGVSVV